MTSLTYLERRGQLEAYFDRTAAEAWARLTSDLPVGRIRATVRAGRERMRRTLLDWLPQDLRGRRLLDAGCGTGALAVEAARRGARVVAIDLSENLLIHARERVPHDLGDLDNLGNLGGGGSVEFRVGDMLDPGLGRFDHIVAMDSLIHYELADAARALGDLAARAEESVVCTFVPRTPVLALMHGVGRRFPRRDRAPAVQPIGERTLRDALGREAALSHWRLGRSERVASGFYISQALELRRR